MALIAQLISNNPEYYQNLPKNVELCYIEGSALDVLITARNLAHKGWVLANHPLYGNFTPHQQPYRTLLMLPPQKNTVQNKDAENFPPLAFLEQALNIYQKSNRKSLPQDMPEQMRKDCALIDMELMKTTLSTLS